MKKQKDKWSRREEQKEQSYLSILYTVLADSLLFFYIFKKNEINQ